jgi:hypothetical protein
MGEAKFAPLQKKIKLQRIKIFLKNIPISMIKSTQTLLFIAFNKELKIFLSIR